MVVDGVATRIYPIFNLPGQWYDVWFANDGYRRRGLMVALLAVDVGGTFTDFMAFGEEAGFFQAKILTTPHDYAQGIIDCIENSCIGTAAVSDLIHGTTVAINTLIERKGRRPNGGNSPASPTVSPV